ncbi:tetratricopeptide repeat protein [Caenispirillum salinarum]|uniref:tetratricopeptide repeat protein n=1 Tax=Caenispirillum salinarum TaxID=859058 RepID=UPI00384D3761
MPEDFTGRADVRRMLSDWWRDGSPIFLLHAIGGMGKSVLAGIWIQYDLSERAGGGAETEACGRLQPSLVYWWSFYRPASSFRKFLAAFFRETGGDAKRDSDDPEAHFDHLCQVLEDRRVLLVLDGFERELKEYLREAGGRRRSGRGGDAIDPLADELLRHLTRCKTAGRVLMTSRIVPTVLAGSSECVRVHPLTGLTDGEVVDFFRTNGIEGDDRNIVQVSALYGHHPLALRLLVGRLGMEQKPHIDLAKRWDVTDGLRARSSHVLEVSFAGLSEHEAEIMRVLAAEPDDVDRSMVTIVFPGIDEIDAALESLQRRALVQFEAEAVTLHPVVRAHAAKVLPAKPSDHAALAHGLYLASLPPPVKALKLVYHQSRAEHYFEAAKLFYNIFGDLFYSGLYYEEILSAAEGFFDGSSDIPLGSLPPDYATFVMTARAHCIRRLGDLEQALRVFGETLRIDVEAGNGFNEGMTCLNSGEILIALGRLEEAENMLSRALNANSVDGRIVSRHDMFRGKLLSLMNRKEGAPLAAEATRFHRAELDGTPGGHQKLCVALCYEAETNHYLGRAETARALAEKALEHAANTGSWRERARTTVTAVLCDSSDPCDHQTFVRRAEEAVATCRAGLQLELEVQALVLLAGAHARGGAWGNCRRQAMHAARMAAAMGLQHRLADAHLLLAEAMSSAGLEEDFLFHLGRARECIGQAPYHYHRGATAAAVLEDRHAAGALSAPRTDDGGSVIIGKALSLKLGSRPLPAKSFDFPTGNNDLPMRPRRGKNRRRSTKAPPKGRTRNR